MSRPKNWKPTKQIISRVRDYVHEQQCAECGYWLGSTGYRISHGDGTVRCFPKCVEKYKRRMRRRITRNEMGQFTGKAG